MAHVPPTVSLVFPRVEYHTGDPPLGLAYVAAALRTNRPDVAVHLVDGTFLGSEAALLEAVAETRPAVVGVFADSLTAGRARRIARHMRRAGGFAVAGGPMASVAPEPLIADFDAVVTGEAEELIAPLVTAVLDGDALDAVPNLLLRAEDGGHRWTERRPCGPDLKTLPWPAWDLLDMARYTRLWPYLDSHRIDTRGTNLVASRGCPWACTYCQPTLRHVFGKRVRRRDPEDVAAEVAALQRRYDIEGIFFHDDTLLANRDWAEALAEALRGLQRPLRWGCNSRADTLDPEIIDTLAAAGLCNIHIGIEAGSERVRRDIYDKQVDIAELEVRLAQLERRGIAALGFFMLGAPTETVAEMIETVRLAQRLRLREATFSLTSVLPGTRLYERVAADPRFALLTPSEGIDYYNGRNFRDRELPLSDAALRAIQFAGLAGFYLSPRRVDYILRHLESRAGLAKLALKTERFLRPILPTPGR